MRSFQNSDSKKLQTFMKFMQDFYQVSNFMHHPYCVFFVEDGLSGVLAGNRGFVL